MARSRCWSGLAVAARLAQQAHQRLVGGGVVGLALDPGADVGEQAVGGEVAAHQFRGERGEPAVDIFGDGDSPGVEIVAIGQVERVEEFAASGQQRLDLLVAELRGVALGGVAQVVDVDVDRAGGERGGFAVGDDRLAEHAAQLAQAPAERALGVVGHFPEQMAQVVAPVGAAGGGEVAEQGAGLARRGQRDRRRRRRGSMPSGRAGAVPCESPASKRGNAL